MSRIRSVISTSFRALQPRAPASAYSPKVQPRIQYRAATRLSFPGRGPQYSRFNRVNNIRGLWQQSPAFRYGVGILGAGGGVFYFSNMEEVPVRLRVDPDEKQLLIQH